MGEERSGRPGASDRGSLRRTTVAEAAELLGISAEAVRGRVRRGTLPVEREGGAVYVLLDPGLRERANADHPRPTADRTDDRTELLIAEMQDRIRSLEEANRENRRIIAALTSRIPELEPPREARGASETDSGAVQRERPFTEEERPQEGAQPRSWWRRMFGG